jgi:hypothetical protein
MVKYELMQPKRQLVTIGDNINLIKRMLAELVIAPRLKALEWSRITKQTPNMKIGYPGQHLASLVLGMEGSRTGARGHDIVDGSEVKSCSRVDQVDKCRDCDEKVMRMETECPACGSINIKRNNDSKWLFTIKTKADLDLLINKVNRVVLTIADYPEFATDNHKDIRFQVFEIWNNHERFACFAKLMTNYYEKIYLAHKDADAAKSPAPKNFWPYTYQFYKCNPVKIFSAIVYDANTVPKIQIQHYVNPRQDRSVLPSEDMPTEILTPDEIEEVFRKVPRDVLERRLVGVDYKSVVDLLREKRRNYSKIQSAIPMIDEGVRKFLPLRDTDKISVAKGKYVRK